MGAGPRFSLFYAALFLQVGVLLPFFPVVLTGRTLSPAELGLVLAAISAARSITIPFMGYLSDRYRLWRGFLAALGLCAALGAAGFGFVSGFWPCLLLGIVTGPLYPSITPIVDAHALRGAAREGHDFGRMRLWGSLGFLLANVTGGVLIGSLGQESILTIIVALSVVGGLSALLLPGGVHAAAGETQRIDLRAAFELLTAPRFLAVLLIGGGIQTSHAVLYNFGTLVWRAEGVSPPLIGLLWAVGVAAEIVLFTQSRRILRVMRPERLLVIGGLAGLLRWGALALAPPLPVLFALQLLHALTFAATFIAAIHLVQAAVPARLAATAQALYAVAAGGIFFSLLTAAAGPLYDHFGTGVYFAPALLAGACGIAGLFAFARPGTVSPTAPVRQAP